MDSVYFGQILHSKSFDEFELFTDGFVAVVGGKIVGVGNKSDYQSFKNQRDGHLNEVVLSKSQFLMPGFIDCHIHAPQMPNIGLGLDKPLLEWLDAYTFPLESQYKNDDFAQKVYEKVVQNTLQFGTTCATYFATIYNSSTKLLTEEVLKQGQRALIGKVSSNRLCPDFYIENSIEESVRDNIEFINFVLDKQNDLVKPIITPRFALTCDMKLMQELGKLAHKYDIHIQSHISENLGEIEAIKEFYPDSKHYSDVYDQANLLTNKCVMAHAVHLEDDEIKVFQARGTSVAHCPSSNTNLGSGFCDVKRLIAGGIKVGLGTDVAGGNKVGILDAIRATLEVSQNLSFAKKQDIKGTGKVDGIHNEENLKYTPINYTQAIYLATLGGAEALSLSDKIGNFVVGKEFDALLIETNEIPIYKYELPEAIKNKKSPRDNLLELIQKFVYVGDDRNILNVFVNGKKVK